MNARFGVLLDEHAGHATVAEFERGHHADRTATHDDDRYLLHDYSRDRWVEGRPPALDHGR